MRYLGEIEFGATVKNLTSEVGVSRSIFSNFPQQVKHDTAYERNCEYTAIKIKGTCSENSIGNLFYSYPPTQLIAND